MNTIQRITQLEQDLKALPAPGAGNPPASCIPRRRETAGSGVDHLVVTADNPLLPATTGRLARSSVRVVSDLTGGREQLPDLSEDNPY